MKLLVVPLVVALFVSAHGRFLQDNTTTNPNSTAGSNTTMVVVEVDYPTYDC